MDKLVPIVLLGTGVGMMAAHAVYYKQDDKKCSVTFNWAMAAWFGYMGLTGAATLSSTLKKSNRRLESMSRNLVFNLFTTSYIMAVLLLTYDISPCLPVTVNYLDWTIPSLLAFFFFLFCLLWLARACHRRSSDTELSQVKVKLDEVLQYILDPNFDVEGFLKKNKASISKIEFTQREIAILRDNFVVKYRASEPQASGDSKPECPVCMYEFKRDQEVVKHPVCHHTFHLTCFMGWIDLNKSSCTCPLCRLSTREAMIRQLRQNLYGDEVPEAGPAPRGSLF